MSHETDLEYIPGKGHRVRLRYGKGLRGRFWIKLDDEQEAKRRADKMRELADMLGRAGHSARAPIILEEAGAAWSAKDFAEAVEYAEKVCGDKAKKPRPKVPTFAELGERWTAGKLASEFPDHVSVKKTKDHDESRLEVVCAVSVAPGLKFGDLPLDAVSLDHCQTVMANLPARAKRPATRRQYAQLLHRVMELAVFPCRYLAASPLPRGFMPKIGKPPAFPYLYPDEDSALLGWTSERAQREGVSLERPGIPLGRRLLWGFLAREGCRSGEAVGLRVGIDADLARGVVSLDRNKSDDARAWALDPHVAEALRAYVKARGAKDGEFLFVEETGAPFAKEDLAEQLRADLEAAGIKRSELLTDGENTRKMRAHDLRGTFVTLSLANGRTETWVADRTGHTSSIMINRYRRAARTAAELGLGPLAPLDRAIPELPKAAQGGPKGGPAPRRGSPRRRPRGSESSMISTVAPPGLEPGRPFGTRDFKGEHEQREPSRAQEISDDTHASEREETQGPTQAHESGAADPVEVALAEALTRAANAGQWEQVSQLARELEARRKARRGTIDLETERRRRGGR